jgi:hypothetical protein
MTATLPGRTDIPARTPGRQKARQQSVLRSASGPLFGVVSYGSGTSVGVALVSVSLLKNARPVIRQ